MVVKVYISRISGDIEIKYRQQRILQILESKNIYHEIVDVAEIGSSAQRDFMHQNAGQLGATTLEPSPAHALPPQVFNDDDYCGDFAGFEMANEVNELDTFLKLVRDEPELQTSTAACVISQDKKGLEG